MPRAPAPTAPSRSRTTSPAYTKASDFLQGSARSTEALLRFSTVAGERGAADAERDVRGFALKFYTEEGNWDLVGNNTPVFFVRDPLKFPDFIHTQKRHPKTNVRSATAMWDFWSLSPESLHQVTILMSDRGLPKSYRHVNGYGSHTYSFLNAAERALLGEVPFQDAAGHPDPDQSRGRSADRQGPRELAARSLRRDREGRFPKWKLQVQIMPELDAETYHHPSVRHHQGLAAQGLPAHRRRRPRAEPQSGKLFRRDRAVGIQPLEHRPRHQLLARQDAAGAHLSPTPTRIVIASAPGTRSCRSTRRKSPVAHLQSRRPDERFDAPTKGTDAFYEPNSFNGPKQNPIRR